MPRRYFKHSKTVSTDLVEYAEEAAAYFKARGYKLSIEKLETGFPYTPTLTCSRQRTTVIVEVVEDLHFDRIMTWVVFAKSSGRDTRFAVCRRQGAPLTDEHENILRDQGIGLYVATGSGLIERIPPTDLGLGVNLPPLTSLPRKLRTLLGSAYDQFNRSHWREGFEDACQAFENEARRYLKAGIKTRIKFVTSKGPKTYTDKQIDRLTMGQLATAFSQIHSQNRSDAIVGHALSHINPDRVGVVHHKSKATTEKRLRTNVGQNMSIIIAAMKEML